MIEESNISKIENISSKFATNCQITKNKLPFIIYQNGKYILKAGFWDNRLEINSIPTAPKEEPISISLDILYGGPISTFQMSEVDLFILKQQVNTLAELLPRYGGRTIENVKNQLEERIKFASHNKG